MNIEKVTKDFVDDFCNSVWEQLQGAGVKSVGVTRSVMQATKNRRLNILVEILGWF